MPSDALADLVSSATRPLTYLREADGEERVRTRLPIAAWLERIERLGSTQPLLVELAEIFRRLDDAEARAENEILDRALVLLGQLAGKPAPTPLERAAAARGGRAAAAAKPAPARPPPPTVAPRPLRTEPATVAEVDAHLRALALPVTTLTGVGPARAKELAKFGIESVEDVLYHLPFRYEDRRRLALVEDLREGEAATALLTVSGVQDRSVGRRGRRVLRAIGRDDTGLVELVWYHQIRWFKSRLEDGSRWLVHGRVERGYDTALRMVHPEMESADEEATSGAPRIVPVYEKPTAMPASAMRRIVHAAVRAHAASVPDTLPVEHRRNLGLRPLADAFECVHEPGPDEEVDDLGRGSSECHRAIIFDELFYVQLGLLLRKASVAREAGIGFEPPGALVESLLGSLPFELTRAQKRVLREIGDDMEAPRPMHRLLQGDVGSGKTVIAVAAALRAIEAGHQAVLMAPTELLAEQHWRTVQQVAGGLGVGLWSLTGETPARERREALAQLAAGEPGLAVGTHALIQDEVRFGRLGLAVIDEQHRFGVMQRAALSRSDGALPPDVLLMTATPIPRTMALSVYGDLDLSTIDELPPSRKPVATQLFGVSHRARAYEVVRSEVEAGRQAYVVYPLVEESEKSDLRDATSAAEELAAGPFADFRVGLVHGRMASSERDTVMRAFRDGAYDVLVATTVIEVGIDVPNASVIVIEHAERFGLSQLHQLRGRVGRGSDAAYCLLIADYAQSNEAKERLRVMTETSDGLRIAEADLEIRGPGALLGTRQAGVPDFRVASLLRDAAILGEARAAAERILAADPGLTGPDSGPMARLLDCRWAGRLGLARIG